MDIVKIVTLTIILCLILVFSSGCSKGFVIVDPNDRPSLESLKDPEPLDMKEVKFKVATRETQKEVFDEIEGEGEEPVLIGLTGENYKRLALNMAEIRRFLELQKKLIESYREYYEQLKE